MGERSHKQSARSEKGNAGCLSGLISIFDFRQGHYTQKLLSDRKRGSSRHLGTVYSRSKLDLPRNIEIKHEDADDVDERGAKKDNLGMASVKTLMEEEMSRTQTQSISSDEVERVRSDVGLEICLKKNRTTSKNCNVVSDLHVNDLKVSSDLDSNQSNYMNPTERSSFNFDLAAFMVEIYSDNHPCQEKHVDSKIDSYPHSETIGHRKHSHLVETESQLAQKHSILQKALADIAEVFLRQNFVDAKQLISNEAAQSKQFMDALEILNSNKELFVKLIQDPNSLLLKHIQDLKNAQIGSELLGEGLGISGQCKESVSHELLQKQSRYNIFRKKDKSKGTKQSKGGDSSQSINKIVILKPRPARIENAPSMLGPSSSPESHHSLECPEDGERVASQFSLKEIKRRLRHVIGESRKERHLISMDGVLHKIPYGFKDSANIVKLIGRESSGTGLASKTSFNTEHTSQPTAIAKKRDKKSKPKECPKVGNHKKLNMTPVAHPPHRESVFYEEAKKHLNEMLATGNENNSLPTEVIPKSLGRILSLAEYNLLSPRFSSGRDKELDPSSQQMRFSRLRQFNQENSSGHLSPLSQSLESTPLTDSNLDNETQGIDTNPECIGEDLKPKETMEIVEIEGIISMEECNNFSVQSESIGDESNVICERCKEEGSSTQILRGASDEKPQLVIPSGSPEVIMEKPERPSPVSVLEPFFSEDVSSPGNTTTYHADLPLQPQQIYFEDHDSSAIVLTLSDSEVNLTTCFDDKEAMFDYVRTLLEESGLSCDEVSERWHSSDQLLHPSLFDEVGVSHSPLPDDPKLLFDCINEVLVEIQERLFCGTLWVSLIKPSARPILRGIDLTQEVCKGIDRHLHSQFLATLDQIVGKGMEDGTWMDLRFETENVVIEMGDAILEEIIEELYSNCGFEFSILIAHD